MKILSIGAHQDDTEFRVGGMAYRWAKAGHEVRFLSMCNGSGGHHIMTPEETTARRAKESAAVAKYLGITYDVWDIDDCTLMPDLPTRERLIRYIRKFNPDLIISHRTNDYHADHRAAAQLVQDASYILTVPHTCPDVPAMRDMPVVLYNVDSFNNPPFQADLVFDMNDIIDVKLHICHLNESQVYEWLPYNANTEMSKGTDRQNIVPTDEKERLEWLKGMNITAETTDAEIMAAQQGYAVKFAKIAARFRQELIARYGKERGEKIRYAEAFQICEYGKPIYEKLTNELFSY